MTGLEIMAIASAVQAGGKMIKGGLDWLDGGKATDLELKRMKDLREKLNAEAVTDADVQRAEQFGTRKATSTMNQAVENARGAMAFQGMGSSGLANQVGLKQAQQLADAQTTQGIQMRERQTSANKAYKEQAEENLYNYKKALADRRKAVMQQGASNFMQGGLDLMTLGAQQKMLGSGGMPKVTGTEGTDVSIGYDDSTMPDFDPSKVKYVEEQESLA
jgi:hypothetical protein